MISGKRSQFLKADKNDMIIPLAGIFLEKGIVAITDEADPSMLSRGDVTKMKTF